MRTLTITTLFFLLLAAIPAWGGAYEPEKPAGDEEEYGEDTGAQDEESAGTLRFLAFRDGVPAAGLVVQVDDLFSAHTSADGAVELSLSEGMHTIRLTEGEERTITEFTIPVVAGRITQIIATLHGDGSDPELDLELPEMPERPIAEAPVLSADRARGKGRIAGRVLSAEKNESIAGARVFVRGTTLDLVTDRDGRFSAEVLEGSYSLSVIHPKFSTRTIDNIEVLSGLVAERTIELTPVSLELEEYVVVAPHIEGGIASLQQEKKEVSSVADVIGAEQMAKSGDSDAASALKRVTGLTVVGGKYVYVRGLGERYSCTLLNGSFLPSPEPERRVVPLDLFPTGILESMVIQKTFSPDLPAEFGGGAVLLRTRGVPEERFFKIGLSIGYGVGDSFTHGLSYRGGATDWLGFDDGTRALPKLIAEQGEKKLVEKTAFQKEGFTPEEIEAFGEALPNIWSAHETLVLPSFGMSVMGGDRLKFGEHAFGVLGSFSYGYNPESTVKTKSSFAQGGERELVLERRLRYDITSINVKMGGILDLGYFIGDDHKIGSTTLVVRTTDNDTALAEGFNRETADDVRITRIGWVEQMLIAEQVRGSHRFSLAPEHWKLHPEYRYTFSTGTRYEPDRRMTRYDHTEDAEGNNLWILTPATLSNERLYSNLTDINHEVGADIGLEFPLWLDLAGRFKQGFSYFRKDRDVDTRRFQFAKGPKEAEVRSRSPEELFSPENIGPDKDQFVLREVTRESDNYSAGQDLWAYYFLFDISLVEPVKLLTGLRYENSRQKVSTYELYKENPATVDAKLHTKDILPAVVITYEFLKDLPSIEAMQVRAGFGITVSRPDFRELSPITSSEVEQSGETQGNPDLKRAIIYNYDLRWEWYLSSDESVSLGFFYKHFKQPIETIYLPGSADSRTFKNARSARNWGLELEWRKGLGFIAEAIADLYLAGNISYINSEIAIPNEKKRPLQGQSPFVVNMMAGYDNIDWGTSIAILYNVFGKRIQIVGDSGGPDTYEQPFHQIDLVASQKLDLGFKIGLKFKNILDLPAVVTKGGKTIERYPKGREISLSVGWDY